jgi:hypothetical protein
MPGQDKGVMTVDPSYSLAGCSSAVPASASLDRNIITHRKQERKHKRKITKLIVCLSNRLWTIPWKSREPFRTMACRTFVPLSEHLIWFHDIFKIIGKDHQCRRIMSSVSRETVSRGHEEMDGGASGNSAVRQ